MLKGPSLLPPSTGKPKKLVVFFHGYGSNGDDLLSLASSWAPLMPDVEFIAPHGPDVCESYALGYQWFSLKEFTTSHVTAGLLAIRPLLKNYLITLLKDRDLTPQDLALVGFSQGGMVALDMLFVLEGLEGIISYSGGFYPPFPEKPLLSPYPQVLLVHGKNDTIVPYAHFLEAQHQLEHRGLYAQTLTSEHLGHSIDEQGIKKGGEFLTHIFA